MKCSSCRIKVELLVEVIVLGYVFWLCEDCMEAQNSGRSPRIRGGKMTKKDFLFLAFLVLVGIISLIANLKVAK